YWTVGAEQHIRGGQSRRQETFLVLDTPGRNESRMASQHCPPPVRRQTTCSQPLGSAPLTAPRVQEQALVGLLTARAARLAAAPGPILNGGPMRAQLLVTSALAVATSALAVPRHDLAVQRIRVPTRIKLDDRH